MRKLAIVLAPLLVVAVVIAVLSVTVWSREEGSEIEWQKTFGGPEYDTASSVQQTSDSGYIIAGCTSSYGAGGSDFWLVKTDEGGEEQWSKTFGGHANDMANSVQQTSDGGCIIAGETWSYGAGESDFWLIKTDEGGEEEWSKTFGGPNYDWAESAQQTSDGGYIIAGYTMSYGAGSDDFWLIKTDFSGNETWNKTFGGPEVDVADSVQQTSDSGYIIAGRTMSYGAGGSDFWLVKTDEVGEEQWSRTFGGPSDDGALSVRQTSDGGYIIAGFTMSYDVGVMDCWLVKTDGEGEEQWSNTFGGPGQDVAESVQQTSDGGYIITGKTRSYGAGELDFWLVKMDEGGEEQWSKTFGGPATDRAHSVQQTSDGGYIIAGGTKSYGAGGMDFWVIKLQ